MPWNSIPLPAHIDRLVAGALPHLPALRGVRDASAIHFHNQARPVRCGPRGARRRLQQTRPGLYSVSCGDSIGACIKDTTETANTGRVGVGAFCSSALARAQNHAVYGAGISQNRPFIDGNKRAAFLSVGLFLALNGYRLVATQAEATLAMFSLAAGELKEEEFAAWLRHHVEPRRPSPAKPVKA